MAKFKVGDTITIKATVDQLTALDRCVRVTTYNFHDGEKNASMWVFPGDIMEAPSMAKPAPGTLVKRNSDGVRFIVTDTDRLYRIFTGGDFISSATDWPRLRERGFTVIG